MDVGVVATPAGLQKYSKWVASIERFIDVPPPNPKRKRNDANTFVWPGFEAVYGAAWPSKPFATCLIDAGELSRRILGADRHQAIYSAVALYVARQSGWEHSDNQDGHFGGRGGRMIVATRR